MGKGSLSIIIVALESGVTAETLQQRDALVGALSRYVSAEVARRLIDEEKLPALVGAKKRVTILACNIHNANNLTDRLTPEQFVNLLNEFFDRMVSMLRLFTLPSLRIKN